MKSGASFVVVRLIWQMVVSRRPTKRMNGDRDKRDTPKLDIGTVRHSRSDRDRFNTT